VKPVQPNPAALSHRAVARRHRSRGAVQHESRWLAYGLALVLVVPLAADGANSALLSAAASILYLGWSATAFLRVSGSPAVLRRMAPVVIPLVLFLLWTAAPLYRGLARDIVPAPLDPDLLGIVWCHAAALVAVLLGCGLAGRLRGFTRDAATGLCVCAALLMVATLLLRAFGEPGVAGSMIAQRDHRFTGLVGNANAAGISFGMISLVMTGVARDRWERWRGRSGAYPPLAIPAAVIGAVVALVLVALTQSRAAFGATVLAQAVYALPRRPGLDRPPVSPRHRAVALLALALGAAAVWLAATSVLTRYAIADLDGPGRVAVLRHYFALARDVPLSGYGLGGFDRFNQRHLTPDTVLLVGDFGAAHNAPLQLVIEAGWPALALVAIALLGIGSHIVRTRDAIRAPIARAMLLAVGVAGVGSMIDIALNVPAIAALTAALLGLVWGRALGDAAADPPGSTSSPQRETPAAAPWPTPDMRN